MKASLIALLLVAAPVAAQFTDRNWSIQPDAAGGWSGTDQYGNLIRIDRDAVGGFSVTEQQPQRHRTPQRYREPYHPSQRYREYR